MSRSCLICGGLILEPNKVYGYAGAVCYCVNKTSEHGFQIPQINITTNHTITTYRFVSDKYLLPKLPAFICADNINDEKLNKIVDLIEEELILKKAEEIKKKRDETERNRGC